MARLDQKEKIIAFCKTHGSITAREAFTNLDINSPRKVISDIRQSPLYDVSQIDEKKVNEAGDTVSFRRYFIKEVAQ